MHMYARTHSSCASAPYQREKADHFLATTYNGWHAVSMAALHTHPTAAILVALVVAVVEFCRDKMPPLHGLQRCSNMAPVDVCVLAMSVCPHSSVDHLHDSQSLWTHNTV